MRRNDTPDSSASPVADFRNTPTSAGAASQYSAVSGRHSLQTSLSPAKKPARTRSGFPAPRFCTV
ncbi:MAG: hypothetical protein IJ119_05455 [Clostridia bacterium]|nr:hypothetical protein [Clostridia bacterium]